MAPRGFDRYMVVVGASRNRKFARMTDSEKCAHFLGVLSVAAQSPRRGYLLVSEHEEAGPEEVASEAGVSVKVAKNAMAKLVRVGVLERDEEVGAWFVHDWNDVNPSPGASRTKRWRDAQTSPDGHTSVTKDVSNGHANVTDASQKPSPEVKKLEVEVEVEENVKDNKAELRSAVVECFVYWQEKCGHKQARLTEDRKAKILARLREGYTVADIHQGVDGAARAAFVDEKGKRFDDIELICRKGSKLEDFMARAVLPNGNVVAMQRPAALERMDAWRNAPEYQQGGDAG